MQSIKEKLPEIKENVSLADYTTFKMGGSARYFFIAENEKDLILAIKTAEELNLSFFIMGSGSNILALDKGYGGLVIKMSIQDISIKDNTISVAAGLLLSRAVITAAKELLTGLEWAIGIPGTIGAAVYGNSAAFGLRMQDVVKSVRVLDVNTLKIKEFFKKDCKFNNKESIFKKRKNLIILSVNLKLKKGKNSEIESEMKRCITYRKENHPLAIASAGCVFKNYDKKITNKNLLKKYPELIEFNKRSKIPASYLIDRCGLKGKVIGKAKVSEKHANFIINLGGAKTKDVIKLIKVIKIKVKDKFNIKLKEEVQYLK